MSLDFNFSGMIARSGREEYDRITDHPTVAKRWHPVTDALIWATMGVGISAITEQNVDEFIRRYGILQAIHGPELQRPSESDGVYITAEDVRNHIGMVTNATTYTDEEFNVKVLETASRVYNTKTREQNKSAYDIAKEEAQKHLADAAQTS